MRIKPAYFIALLMCIVFVDGCAKVPSVQVSQPWSRILFSQEAIKPGAKIKVEVTGLDSPILGKEDLAFGQVRDILTALLVRRGFMATSVDYDYVIKLNYKTERNDKVRMSSLYSAASYDFGSSYNTAAVASHGYGVSLARAVSQRSTAAASTASTTIDQEVSYTHMVSVEFVNNDSTVLWKGDTTWDEPNLNIVSNLVSALQMVLSSLPSIQTMKPEIGKIKESHVDNYFTLKCLEQRWYTCPALPFKIYIIHWPADNYMSDFRLPWGMKDTYALAAYIDLIQTAEFALPDGDTKDWSNPFNINLWKRVTLGGRYLIGPEKQPVNVIIKLSGESSGYYIDSTNVVTDKDYALFQQKLSNWERAMKDYRDFYVKK